MREILFRGKRRDNDEWEYGNLIISPYLENCVMIERRERKNGYFATNVVDPESVGQYTGLKDKNGQRIFEGDIIKTHYANTPKADFIEQVVFHNGRFCGMYEHGTTKIWATLADGIKHLPQDKSVYMEWCEVIGNNHDNPELLREG